MIDKKANESVEQAVCYELQNIVKKYGPVYHSEHEAYAILKEEVEETEEGLKFLIMYLESIWNQIRKNQKVSEEIKQAKMIALNIAKEAVQCAAVCERFQETVKNK